MSHKRVSLFLSTAALSLALIAVSQPAQATLHIVPAPPSDPAPFEPPVQEAPVYAPPTFVAPAPAAAPEIVADIAPEPSTLAIPSDTDKDNKDAALSVYNTKPSEPGFIERIFRKFTNWSDKLVNGDDYSYTGPNGQPRRMAITRIDREAEPEKK